MAVVPARWVLTEALQVTGALSRGRGLFASSVNRLSDTPSTGCCMCVYNITLHWMVYVLPEEFLRCLWPSHHSSGSVAIQCPNMVVVSLV